MFSILLLKILKGGILIDKFSHFRGKELKKAGVHKLSKLKTQKNYLIIVTIALIVALVTIKLSYVNEKEGINRIEVKKIPLVLGQWAGSDIPVTERTYENLETRNVLLREYINQSLVNNNQTPVYLCIVFSEDNKKVSHPPEVCYEGGGRTNLSKAVESVQIRGGNLNITKLIIQNGSDKELVLYWYMVGNLYTCNYYKQQLNIVLNQISGKNNKGALIRFSTPIIENDETEALNYLKKFIEETNPIISKYL